MYFQTDDHLLGSKKLRFVAATIESSNLALFKSFSYSREFDNCFNIINLQ